MTCVIEKHFNAIVLVEPSTTTSERVELVAGSWAAARALLHARFGTDSIVNLWCVEEVERLR